MYRIDVYNKNPKKNNHKYSGSHWYNTKQEAEDAKHVLINMPRKVYTFVPGQNREQKMEILGGYHVSGPFEDSKFQ